MRRTIWLTLLCFVALTLSATSLTGSLKAPDGTGANGYIYFQLSQQAALNSGGCGGPAEIVPTQTTRFQVINGAMQSSPSVYGNDCLLPGGTYYNVRLVDTNANTVFTDRWVITGASVDIGTIVSAVITGTTITLGSASIIFTTPAGAQTVTQPSSSYPLNVNYLNVTSILDGPGTMYCTSGGCTLGALTIPALASSSGTRYVCSTTAGALVSSVTPCSGT